MGACDILPSVMTTAQSSRPLDFRRWEWWTLVVAVALLVFLAAHGKGRRERLAYERFQEVAPQVQAALERFAADHQGRFPPDSMMTSRPRGLTERYISWDQTWKVDYEVHDNGQGGQAVCLEFCGPFAERHYFGLCRKPELRRLYGRGQPIPGQVNRLWVIREQAEIMDRNDPALESPPPAPPAR